MKASRKQAHWGIGLLLAAACSSTTASSRDSGTGAGGTMSGGVPGAGGAASGLAGAGGAAGGTGGSAGSVGTSGTTATGGLVGTGGLAAMGGATSSGTVGAGGVGGSAGAGGSSMTGGAPGTGGALPDAAALDASGDGVGPGTGGAGGIDARPGDTPTTDSTPDSGRDAGLDTPSADSPATPGSTCVGPASAALANASLPSGYCAWTWASGLSAPRGIARNAQGDILVVEQDSGRIVLLYDDDGNGVSDDGERVVLTTTSGLNHGIALQGGFLYASSATTVYRWPYAGGRQVLGSPQTVVTGIPSGGHSTRTLLLDGDGNLYVSVGSASNLDTNTDRARIIRYPASALGSASTFAQGEAFATGLRNEVGITLDGQGRVWGVQNGSDNLSRSDLGGDIHNDNPGEELNLFAEPGRFHGYPYCWSEFLLPSGTGMGPGTQWAYPSTMDDGTHSDAWCRDTDNVVPPVLVMQAHSAPLDIKFYTGGAFPADMQGSALVTYHGSWNRSPATGYKVMRIPFGADGMPSGAPAPLLEYSAAGDTGSGWPHRPVGIETGLDGRLFVTSDASDIVIAIGYGGG